MDNLQLQYAYGLDLPRPVVDDEDDPVLSFCLDSTEEGLLYAATQSGQVQCFEQHGKKLLWSVQLPIEELDITSAPAAAAAAPIAAFAHVVELDALFVACSNGQLLLLDTASREADEVGMVTGGVAAAGWSPNGEQLAVLGYNGLLLTLNKEWDVLSEVAVPPPQPDQQLLSATLTWRGDSSYLATNTYWGSTDSSSSSSRVLHIWDRETGQLHATGQAAAGLSAAVAWQPNCRHLFAAAAVPPPASTAATGQPQLRAAPHQRVVSAAKTSPPGAAAAATTATSTHQQPDSSWQQHIILYERNGLQHGGFDVPTFGDSSSDGSRNSSNDVVIYSLYWSSDSRLLAVVLAPEAAVRQQQQQQQQGSAEGAVPHEWRLQLWCRSNWHWHLKHEQRHELPDVSGGLMVCWDETLPARLHLMSGAGRYSRLDFGWCLSVSGRGTAAVIDGHQVLLTPLRHGLVPPPMCAVRGLLPRPAVALAWCDGDVEGDLDSWLAQQQTGHANGLPSSSSSSHINNVNGHSEAGNSTDSPTDRAAPAANGTGGTDGAVDVVGAGYCEVLAVLLSDGQLVFFRAVESDLWDETLEDQVALGGPKEYLLPLGYSPTAAATAAAGGSSGSSMDQMLANDAEYYGGSAMPTGPWSNNYGSAVTAVSTQGGDVQRLQFAPLSAAAVAAGASSSGYEMPTIPLAEGRTVLSLVWLGQQQLLLLAAPLEEGLEDGEGTVLIEVSVTLPASLFGLSAGAIGSTQQQQQQQHTVETSAVCVSYAGGQVLTAASHPAGGAVLQMPGGKVLYYPNSSSQTRQQQTGSPLVPLSAAANFPCSCPTMLLLPHAPNPVAAVAAAGSSGSSSAARQAAVRVAAAAPAVGLNAAGVLYWGSKVVATDVSSVAVRGGGPGGPALLYVTRQSLLYMLMVGQLPKYRHTLPDESSGLLTWKRSEHPGELMAAVSTAMRPTAAAAATRDTHMRAVEQGASLLSVPYGGVDTVLIMPRGNLEGICPRLLVLAAITDALDCGAYARAWDLAVTNRVDLNLLVDYAWPRFLTTAADFVAAVPSASDLGDLLLALTPQSTLEPGGIYATVPQMLGWTQQQQQGQGQNAGAAAGAADSEGAGKVSRVCEAIRQAVLQLPGRFVPLGHLKTVVMSYARTEPPSLEGALSAIRDVKEAAVAHSNQPQQHQQQQQQQQQADAAVPSPAVAADGVSSSLTVTADDLSSPPQLSAAADAALKHLLLYVDVDQLYQAALGLYDLPLAFMVVSHSQKDPGEYLSELSRFGSISDIHMQRHAIDVSLGRFSKALDNLVAAGPVHFEAALKLAREKGLLRQLLALTQQQQQQEDCSVADSGSGVLTAKQRLVAVLSAHGDALMAARKAEDAAVAYSAAGLMEQALGAYRAAGAWRMSMVLAARLQYTAQQQQELARELAEQLLASGAGADAAVLLLQHLGDVDGAVAALVAAKEWREGLRVAYANGRADLVDTDMVPAAAQAASVLLSDANEAIERITKYSTRLKEVRQRREAMAAALAAAEAEAATGAPEDDLVSEAPSMISGFSIYTDRTNAGATGIGSSSAASSFAASTVGGRKPMRQAKKSKVGKKIRAGAPGEEIGLETHLLTLSPAKHVLEEAGQLAEMLVMLQHVADATKLQQRVGQWQAAAAEATALVAQGQQQQQQPPPQQQQQQQQGGGTAAQQVAAALSKATAAAAAAAEVHWKWDVLREHK